VFNRVLLCYDGSADGRRALKRGAEFAILVGAEVHVLSILAGNSISPAVLAAAQGYACLVDEEQQRRELLDDCIARLKSRGVKAHAHLAKGETIPAIVAYSKELMADLIVVGHYPNAEGRRWWAAAARQPLAEQVDCCVFIAVGEGTEPIACEPPLESAEVMARHTC
jgi:nucleotide-binding universal stress UspA family protein